MVVSKYRSRRVEVYDERLTDRSREASELSKFRLVRMLPSEQKLRDYEFTHLDVQRAASQRSKLDMQDKVVMGDQNYGLRGLTRFSDNEGAIIWPAWRAELRQLVKFEIGTIGNKIIEGEFTEEDVVQGEVTGDLSGLVNALIPRTRAEIQTRSDWMEQIEVEV